MTHRTKSLLDVSGASLSVVCLLHCLALPTAAVAAPALAPELAERMSLVDGRAHLILFLIAAPVTVLAFFWGEKAMRAGKWTMGVAGTGLALMLAGASHLIAQPGETVLTVTGVSLLIAAHIANWHRRQSEGHDHARECGMCED
ncbi:MerC domain-containing protein [Hyphobacterium sp. HN65]|uniref:MerC domain-containing protein n=1 Tax=Hyphobacterium lacteum TaxID=3116575 RepID=A0ABU7LUN4_9PROT|nr:MerC domain-containing protein [Hyphobacterium sp. HN65]MEE2527326.1 MerC domain-containing protein [Hyphobacterium sp. HN65]